MKLTTAQLQLLASNLYQYYRQLDNPPADEISIPIEAIKQDQTDQTTYYAIIKFAITWCKEKKTNTIRIRFKIDDKGRFIRDTIKYA